ncbi:MAG TPA: 1-acyl-sn-glycerol-3-phosphate acyltransferase [Cryomorphaceae bacterium]|nr:1-acyl-sn-glycerol-3-phosphate acyltransferase [Cryomorphaceae bacterium]
MRQAIDRTVRQLTVEGLDDKNKDRARLYISNHRDIILDSAILNVALFEAGFGTIETAIGNNLLSDELVADLTKLNKNFVVKRNTGAREFYENSMLLSAYIRDTIVNRGSGVWIAQREGRTKDGMDKTQPGLLKMLGMKCEDSLRQCFRELKVTPVAISYEYDPCDVLKIPELKAISREEKYQKAPNEDFRSILTGIIGDKGRVHLKVGKTLDEELEALADFPSQNDKLRVLGEIIDKQIFTHYKLWPTNYIALDLAEGTNAYRDFYTDEERRYFEDRMAERLAKADLNEEEDRRMLLNMYANPVKNVQSVLL